MDSTDFSEHRKSMASGRTSYDHLVKQRRDMPHRRHDYQSAMQPYINNMISLLSIHKLKCKDEKDMVKVNINGTVFSLPRSVCMKIPAVRKTLQERQRMKSHWPFKKINELFYERNTSVFAYVVDYVENKELHAPLDTCPRLFAYELTLWGFDVDELQPCCFGMVVNFLYEQERLRRFQGFLHKQMGNNQFLLDDSLSMDNLTKKSRWGLIRTEAWNIIDDPFSGSYAKAYFTFMVFAVLLNFFAIAASTHSYFHYTDGANSTTPTRLVPSIVYIDLSSIALLYLDYALRILFYPCLAHFFYDFVNVADGLSNLASIVKIVVERTMTLDKTDPPIYLHTTDMIQLLRMLHLLRPMSKMTGFRLIYYTVVCSIRELTLVLMLLLFLTMFFSSLLYYLGNQSFKSIPSAMWFTVITMTTVGYGDVIPKDFWSMVIGSVVAVFGVIMMSMTTPIMVSNFHALYINAVVGEPSNVKKAIKEESKPSLAATISKSNVIHAGRQPPGNVAKKSWLSEPSWHKLAPMPHFFSFRSRRVTTAMDEVNRTGVLAAARTLPRATGKVSFENEVTADPRPLEKRRRRCDCFSRSYSYLGSCGRRPKGTLSTEGVPGREAEDEARGPVHKSVGVSPKTLQAVAKSPQRVMTPQIKIEEVPDSSEDTFHVDHELESQYQKQLEKEPVEAVTETTESTAETSEETKSIISSNGDEADSESDIDDDRPTLTEDDRDYKKRIREKFKNLIRPHHRSWYANYEESESSDSELSSGVMLEDRRDFAGSDAEKAVEGSTSGRNTAAGKKRPAAGRKRRAHVRFGKGVKRHSGGNWEGHEYGGDESD